MKPRTNFGNRYQISTAPSFCPGLGYLYLGGEVKGDEKGDHTDEDILDHLDCGGHEKGLLTQKGSRGSHGAGRVDSAAHPGATENLLLVHREEAFDDQRA